MVLSKKILSENDDPEIQSPHLYKKNIKDEVIEEPIQKLPKDKHEENQNEYQELKKITSNCNLEEESVNLRSAKTNEAAELTIKSINTPR